MFKPARLAALLIVSILVTTGLYYLDSDPPSDTLLQRAQITSIIFIVITILYAGSYGLFQALRGKRG